MVSFPSVTVSTRQLQFCLITSATLTNIEYYGKFIFQIHKVIRYHDRPPEESEEHSTINYGDKTRKGVITPSSGGCALTG
jgi:hypothetical protein